MWIRRIKMNQFDAKWFAEYSAKRAKRLQELLPYEKMPKEVKKPVQSNPERKESKLEKDFEVLWKSLGGPKLEREFRFHEKRRWRFDFCVLANSVAIEIEGGQFGVGKPCPTCKRRQMGGHHTFKGFREDCEKYASATLLGWRIFRFPGSMITKENVLPIIELCRKQTKLLEDLGI